MNRIDTPAVLMEAFSTLSLTRLSCPFYISTMWYGGWRAACQSW